MFIYDLTNFEQKVDEVIDTIKLIVTEFQMPKPLRKEIKKMLKLVIENKRSSDGDNIISVWEALSGMLHLFAETIVGKTYNKGVIKNPKTKKMIQLSESQKLELMRLEAFIYLAIVLNEMDIFLNDYGGESLLEELRTVASSQDKTQLLQLTIRFRGILSE